MNSEQQTWNNFVGFTKKLINATSDDNKQPHKIEFQLQVLVDDLKTVINEKDHKGKIALLANDIKAIKQHIAAIHSQTNYLQKNATKTWKQNNGSLKRL